jgi:cysteinyl-tRNA synthetase
MNIFLHNTLTGKKEEFVPIEPGKISMYNCGPTVYDYAHIGNLRSYVFADVLRRMFEYNGYEVNQVINITDIGHLSSDADNGEDKMTKALKREGKPMTLEAMREIADVYFGKFKEDLISLNIKLPQHFPFASDHIKEDIEVVEKLVEKGFAYKTSDGMYFDTEKFPDYGKLGGVSKDADHGRIETNSEKKNFRDFAVWKFNEELGYDAPFGKGFPGWHIECSAMSRKYLGQPFDIHTGGIDHIPVHHNNEIAQSEAAYDTELAKVWMHNAFLTVDSGKMAKSEGNFITLNILKERGIDPLAYRYLLLTAHYSSPLNFSWEALEGADVALKRLRKSANDKVSIESAEDPRITPQRKAIFNGYINDNLDTPAALEMLWDVARTKNISFEEKNKIMLDFDRVLGLQLDKVEKFEIPEEVQKLIKERDKARTEKDFAKSDELRKEIESFDFEVMDTPEGTKVEKK